jgi:hypothetical protein
MESILYSYDLRTTKDQVHYHDVVDLHLLLLNACMRELMWEYHLKYHDQLSFGCCLFFLDQPFWLLQLSISNISWITTSMLAFQVPHLVYPHIGRQAPTLGRSDLSLKNILDTHLKWIYWSIQVMDLIWWVIMNPYLRSFLSTCLITFLSTK